jgi:hypothetical protein
LLADERASSGAAPLADRCWSPVRDDGVLFHERFTFGYGRAIAWSAGRTGTCPAKILAICQGEFDWRAGGSIQPRWAGLPARGWRTCDRIM